MSSAGNILFITLLLEKDTEWLTVLIILTLYRNLSNTEYHRYRIRINTVVRGQQDKVFEATKCCRSPLKTQKLNL